MANARFTVKGTLPQELDPLYADDLLGAWDAKGALASLVAEPLFTPLDPSRPNLAKISLDGAEVGPDEVTDLLWQATEEAYDRPADEAAKELLLKTLVNFAVSRKAEASQLFALQAAAKQGLPAPDPVSAVYLPQVDVIPAAKALLTDPANAAKKDTLFAALAFTYAPKTLGATFRTETDFCEFKAFLDQRTKTKATMLTPETLQTTQDFQKLSLDGPVEGVILRARQDKAAGDVEGSFARHLVATLMEWVDQNPGASMLLPFDLRELVWPSTLVFANVDAHAHASANELNQAWSDVATSIARRPATLSTKQILSLGAAARARRSATERAERVSAAQSAGKKATRRLGVKFSKTPPPPSDLGRRILIIERRTSDEVATHNTYQNVITTYSIANRRDPDNPDRKGIARRLAYHPDLYIFLDTSGSITEVNYAGAMKAVIAAAKKLDTNLYFASFSHKLATPRLLPTKGKSLEAIYGIFRKVPKLSGGTEYLPIWNYIQSSPKRRRSLSIIITDFAWTPPRGFHVHPKNLYYFPTGVESKAQWDNLVENARAFADDMARLDPAIRSKILF